MADRNSTISITITAENAAAKAAIQEVIAGINDFVGVTVGGDQKIVSSARERAAALKNSIAQVLADIKVATAQQEFARRLEGVAASVVGSSQSLAALRAGGEPGMAGSSSGVVLASFGGKRTGAGGTPVLPPVADVLPPGKMDVARQKAVQAMRDTAERDRAESVDTFSPEGKREEQRAMARAKADHELAVLEAKHGVAGVQHNQEYHDALQAIHQRYFAACQRADEEYDKWIEAAAARKVARAQRDHETLVSIKQTGVKAAADADEARTPAERLKKRNDEDFAAYTRAAAGVDRKAAEVTADSPEHQQVIDAGQETKRQLYLEYQRKVRDNQERFRQEELTAIEKQAAAERKQFEERVREQDHLATLARSVHRNQDRLELEEAREQGTGPALAVLQKQLAAKHSDVQDAQGRVQTAVGYEPRLQAEREYVAALQDERVIKVQIRLEEAKQAIEAARATAAVAKEILAQRAKDEQFAKKKFELQNLAVIAGLRGEKRELVTDAKDSGLPDDLLGKLDLTQDKDAIYAQIKRFKLEMRFVTPDLTADQKAEVEGLIDEVVSAGESKRSEWQEFWKEMGGDIGKGLDDATHNTLEQISKGFLSGKTRWNKITKELLSDLESVGSKAMADTTITALKASLQAALRGVGGLVGGHPASGAPAGSSLAGPFPTGAVIGSGWIGPSVAAASLWHVPMASEGIAGMGSGGSAQAWFPPSALAAGVAGGPAGTVHQGVARLAEELRVGAADVRKAVAELAEALRGGSAVRGLAPWHPPMALPPAGANPSGAVTGTGWMAGGLAAGVGAAGGQGGVNSIVRSVPKIGTELADLSGVLGKGKDELAQNLVSLASTIGSFGTGGGGPVFSSIFSGVAKVFSFDDAIQDSQARRWGFDFGSVFGQGAKDAFGGVSFPRIPAPDFGPPYTVRRGAHAEAPPVVERSSGGGDTHYHFGDIHVHSETHNHGNGGDSLTQNSRLAEDLASHVRRTLRTL